MKKETILRLTYSSSIVVVLGSSAELSKLINDAFAQEHPECSSVEVRMTDGEIVFDRGEYPIISEDLVRSSLIQCSYQAIRGQLPRKKA